MNHPLFVKHGGFSAKSFPPIGSRAPSASGESKWASILRASMARLGVWLILILLANGLDHTPSLRAAGTDLAIPGSVTVTIQPPEAVADGARWTLDDGPAQPSGFQQQAVAPGRHTVRFGNLPDWREPQAVEVLVIGGRPAQVAATFTRIPSFDFQAVPEQHARHGEAVEFFVSAETLTAQLQVTATPPPAGPITFDAATGRFAYTPAAADRLPFSLMFSTGGVQSATTTITPIPNLPAEESVINYDRTLPDDESRDYITISESRNAAEVFNDATNETLTVDISGKTLVFETSHPANLHRQYSGRENIKELRLFADRVIIRSPLLLPQTHVTIHARDLRFEGGGLIDTTPKARLLRPAGAVWEDDLTVGINGDAGHNGGDVEALVERFHADPTPATRFILNGGAGGAAGEGRDGRAEGTVPFLSADWNKLMARAGNLICGTANGSSAMLSLREFFNNVLQDSCGSQTATARGEPAVRSGIPGVGGRGGTLRSTVSLATQAQLSGGVTGARGNDHLGGTLSARLFIYRTVRTIFRNGEEITTIGDSTAPKAAGANATAPFGTAGVAGSVELISDPAVWLHSFGVRSVVQFAKDAYLNGHDAETRSLLAEYRDVVRALQPAVPSGTNLSDEVFAESTSLDQLTLEMDTLIHRIDSNLDFFGNPAGWVPMLSFEANLVAFEREVDQSIPILYLAYWLNQAATNLQNSLAASGVAVTKLKAELDDLVAAYNVAQTNIPQLKVESDTIRFRIGVMQGRLATLEHDLLERAQQNVEDKHKVPLWKKALGVLSMASHLVPVGQPIVGRVGSGLGLLGQLDTDNPVASATALAPKAFEVFSQKDIRVCFSGSTTNGTNTAEARKEKLKTLSECGKFLGGRTQGSRRRFQGSPDRQQGTRGRTGKAQSLRPGL